MKLKDLNLNDIPKVIIYSTKNIELLDIIIVNQKTNYKPQINREETYKDKILLSTSINNDIIDVTNII